MYVHTLQFGLGDNMIELRVKDIRRDSSIQIKEEFRPSNFLRDQNLTVLYK